MSMLMDLFQTIKKALDHRLLGISIIHGESTPVVAIFIRNAIIENGRIKLLIQE